MLAVGTCPDKINFDIMIKAFVHAGDTMIIGGGMSFIFIKEAGVATGGSWPYACR